jgi:hypothetical protein
MDTPPRTWPLDNAPVIYATPHLSADERIRSCVCGGASASLLSILRFTHLTGATGYVPALWDERVVPLCAVDTPTASFLWDGSMPAHLAPRLTDVFELVRTIVERLRMDAHEVVVAMVLLETLMVRRGLVLQLYSARPLLLATCILASKLTRDADMPTHSFVQAMEGHFTALTPQLGARIERQLLEYLDWRIPNDPAEYRRHTLALLREGTPSHMLPPSIVDVPWIVS